MNETLTNRFLKMRHAAVPFFEEAPYYEIAPLQELFYIVRADFKNKTDEECLAVIERGEAILAGLVRRENGPKKIMLWPEGNMPESGEYTDNSSYRYNHDPDYKPYMLEMLLPADVAPRGALVVCAGGDHSEASFHEAYQTCLDMNARGYQCFLLLNRTNHCPYTGQEAGADVARAIRIIRSKAAEYGVNTNQIAYVGFSNGGVTGEACIRYYSGEKKVTDYFPNYQPDELDRFYGCMDVNLCVYGPRWVGESFDFTGVQYPPTFFAVGRCDKALDNLYSTLPSLMEHNVPVEIHTFAGVPHGQAGIRMTGAPAYENFELWVPLADAFMQDIYKNA